MKRMILCIIMLVSCFSVFADYNQDLELRRHLDMFPKFLEDQDSSIADDYYTAWQYITVIKMCFLESGNLEIQLNAQEYFDEYCEKLKEYDNNSSQKLTFHDFLEWTADYIRTNKGKYKKETEQYRAYVKLIPSVFRWYEFFV